jgi:HK97 family phage major capsid protein
MNSIEAKRAQLKKESEDISELITRAIATKQYNKLDGLEHRVTALADAKKSLERQEQVPAWARGAADSGTAPTVTGKSLTGAQVNPLRLSEASSKTLFDTAQSRGSVKVKAFSTLESLIPAQLDPSVLTKNLHEQRVLDYLPAQAITAPSYEVIVHNSTSGAASPVGEGQAKPEIILNTTSQTLTAIKLACHVGMSYESVSDYSSWQGYIQGEVLRQLQDVENQQLLNGSGSGGNMTGLLATSGILTHDFSADPGGYTSLDAVEASIAQLRVSTALAEPDLLILNPTCWAAMRRTKTSQGAYILNDPSLSAVDHLWGVRVIVTTAMTNGTGLLLDTVKMGKVYIREGISIHTGTNTDDLVKNILRIVLEERLVLGVTRPAAVLAISNLPTA